MTLLPAALVLLSAGMHAGWNLVARARRTDDRLFWRLTLWIGMGGLVPAGFGLASEPPWSLRIWVSAALSGFCLATYFLGLAKAYRGGDFTIVYPIARALPVLILATSDLARGFPPSIRGGLGLGLIVVGCLLLPLQLARRPRVHDYWNPTISWALVVALSTVGYTFVDDLAAADLERGSASAAIYGVLQYTFGIPWLWIAFRLFDRSTRPVSSAPGWIWSGLSALLAYAAYWLVLWAYQLTEHTSYLVGLRQFSIVIGVALGAWIFREPAPRQRILAAILIAAGVGLVATA